MSSSIPPSTRLRPIGPVSFLRWTLAAGLIMAAPLRSEEFGGIDFPQGASSFADRVVSTDPGDPAATDPLFIFPGEALGPPDYFPRIGSYSLGRGGSIVLEFTNNVLTGSGDSRPDLHIFEIGPDVEDTFVCISEDGIIWTSVGTVSGSTSSIDIDSYGHGVGSAFRFVLLRDDPNEGNASGETVGADIDAVGAITTTRIADWPPLRIRSAGNRRLQMIYEILGPTAHWPMNEASGTVAANSGSLGAAADGSYGATAELDQPGLVEGSEDTAVAFSLKDVRNVMRVEDFAIPTESLSVTFLIDGPADGTSFFFGYGVPGTPNELALLNNTSGTILWVNGSALTFPAIHLLDDDPHHCGLTWDQGTGLAKLFIDGILVGSDTISPGIPIDAGGVLAVGQDLDNDTAPDYGFDPAQSLTGRIDEFAIFGRALTFAEVQEMVDAAFSASLPHPPEEFFLEFDSALGSSYDLLRSPDLQGPGLPMFSAIKGTGGKVRKVVRPDSNREFYYLEPHHD